MIRPQGVVAGSYYAVRVESAVNVIKEVLGLHFKASEIQTAVEFVDWASYGKGYFYDLGRNPWPICKQIYVPETQLMHNVPLPEEELIDATLHRTRCLFFKCADFDKIVSDVEQGSKLPHDPKYVVIASANKTFNHGQKYCFWDAVTKPSWFGYRAVMKCTFAEFVMTNAVQIGSGLNEELAKYNEEMGFGTVEECYDIVNLYHFCKDYDVNTDSARMPPCYKYDPFLYDNGPDAYYTMPRIKFTESTYTEPRTPDGGADEVAECDGVQTSDEPTPGSNPPLSDSSNRARPCNPGAPTKKRRLAFIDDEADDDENVDDEVCVVSR